MNITANGTLAYPRQEHKTVNELLYSAAVEGIEAFDAHLVDIIEQAYKLTGAYPVVGDCLMFGTSRRKGYHTRPVYWRVTERHIRTVTKEIALEYFGYIVIDFALEDSGLPLKKQWMTADEEDDDTPPYDPEDDEGEEWKKNL